MDPKSKMYIMIGYCPNGYRLWCKDFKKILVARDVIFNETCYPFKNNRRTASKVTTIKRNDLEEEVDILEIADDPVEADMEMVEQQIEEEQPECSNGTVTVENINMYMRN